MVAEAETHWFKVTGNEEPHGALFTLVKRLDDEQQGTRNRDLNHVQLYLNRDLRGFLPGEFRALEKETREAIAAHGTDTDDDQEPLNYNLARSVTDTANSKICRENPRIQVITVGGSWDNQTRAQAKQRFIDGMMSEFEGYRKATKSQRDSCVMGSGFLVYGYDAAAKSLYIDWAPKWEFFVDEQACLSSEKPMQLYRRQHIAADHLIDMYAGDDEDLAHRINQAAGLSVAREGSSQATVATRMVEVVTGWSDVSDKQGEGRRVVCFEGGTLLDEHGDDLRTVVKFDWAEPMAGYWPVGLVEGIAGIQQEINRSMIHSQRADMHGSKIHIERPVGITAEDFPDEHITDEDYTVWPAGVKVHKNDAVSESQRMYPKVLAAWGYQQEGMSEFEAEAKEPDERLSGKAIMHVKQNFTGRIALKVINYEKGIEGLANGMVRLIHHLAKKGVNVDVLVKDGNSLERIDWKKIQIPSGNYRLRVFPTSNMPETPGGKIQYVQQLIGMGQIDPQFGMQLLGEIPDIERHQSIQLAAIKYTQWCMDRILYHNDYVPPDPIQDLQMGIDWCAATYLYAKMYGAPEELLNKLIDWKIAAEFLRDKQTANALKKQQAIRAQAGMGGELDESVVPESEPELPLSGGAGVPPSGGAPM